jgi:hypothetical protein
MSTEISSWSQLTTEQLEWRRKDLQRQIDANPGKSYTHVKEWIAEIEAELKSRRQSA